ncbi:DUF4175 family protein [Aurantibacter sp.]|uniref:DUF4175 family protein n=1 Tax=Aurantibacter sp. TaxID=2807103 RepID=UPI0035C84D19
MYFILTLLVEHFLWLNSSLRTILFWMVVLVEASLFVVFIVVPLIYLFKIKKGLNFNEASKLIGEHFPEVKDKLTNVLQLKEDNSNSELILASINQKSEELSPISFKNAVNFRSNTKYLKYALIPLLILIAFYVSGKIDWFSKSYNRVINYNVAYEPPAPFKFFVINEKLETVENKPLTLFIETVGDVVPENASIKFNNENYFIESKGSGVFQYTFNRVNQPITFNLSANNVTSKPYTISLINAPQIISFEMTLDYPSYTGKKDETLKSIGNAIIPQGTKVTWNVKSKSTEELMFYSKDTLAFSKVNSGLFNLTNRIYNTIDYTLSTTNKSLNNYENFAFSLKVIKDQYPEISVQSKIDSLDLQTLYFYGEASDDYGLNRLELVYYPVSNENQIKTQKITISNGNFSEFITSFPNNLSIEEGKAYELYFQVYDNDASIKNKKTKSKAFTFRKRTNSEEEQKQLQEQSKTIQDLSKSLKQLDKQENELQELSKTQKEKSTLSFNDKKKIEQFLERQKNQKKLMQDFNKKLKDNLKEFQKKNNELPKEEGQPKDQFKEDLKKRLQENEEKLKEDEKLLEELEKLMEKFDKEQFSEKMNNLSSKSKNQKKSLEQILELTKKYYVTKKLEKIGKELDELAKKQDALANKNDNKNTKEEQDKLNEAFNELKIQLDELEKDNKNLKNPIKLPRNKNIEENVSEDQKEASEALKEEQESQEQLEKETSKKKAKKKQKSAAQQLKKMSMSMQKSMQGAQQEKMEEDTAMLRQILDNLVLFSFNQEANMDAFSNIDVNHSEYSKYLRRQNDLKSNFEHIDDSLFALSLRQPKISEKVNTEISNVYYNIDKALAQLAENDLYKATGTQQYAITAANTLADFLSDILDQMQNQQMGMPAPGEGEGGMPMPDIIISQEELAKKMEKGSKKGDEGKDGEKGEKGEKGKEGKKGKDGESGESGKSGKSGEAGKSGKNGKPGENGQEGKNGKGKGKSGEGKDGNNPVGKPGASEKMNGELFQIYQQQQMLRQALEERLERDGIREKGDASKLIKEMEQVELDILNKGFTQETASKMKNIQHQLMKLEKATLQQNEDTKRKSEANKKEFENTSTNQIETAKQYFNTTEILNKQHLPLQPIYKQKVQQYFKQDNDKL